MNKDDMNLIETFLENAVERNIAVIIVYVKNPSNDQPRVTGNITKESAEKMITDLKECIEIKNEL